MEDSKLVGVLSLKGFPALELFDEFTEKIDKYEIEEFLFELKYKLRRAYFYYYLHVIVFVLIATGFFLTGYYFYDPLFPVSIVFSILFAGTFIYLSKSREIKKEYFKFFRIFFMNRFARLCSPKHQIQIAMKNSKSLIYLTSEY